MRIRLTLLVVATTSLVLLAFLVPLALLLRTVAEDRAVVAATADIQAIAPIVGVVETSAVERTALAANRPITIFMPDGAVLGVPAEQTPAVALAARGRSLTAVVPEGREVVMAVQGLPGGTAVVRTVVPNADLDRGVYRAWLVLAGLGVALLALGAFVADRLARALIAPITELSAVSLRLARAELTARVRPAGPPELRGVAVALNHLATRIQDLLRQEREQVADLSHRLRTPLTALRLDAESLADPAEAERVTAGVDAVERAVTALIRQARQQQDGSLTGRSCDAVAVVQNRVAFWTVLAEDTGRPVTAPHGDHPLPVAVAAEELSAALDALLGNVFAHTPDGTAFAVEVVPRAGGGVVVTVSDAGPGISPGSGDALARGASPAGSTGLGLDIARRAAEASGGGLTFVPAEGGTRVVLELGPPP
jgi:signal transduction histidine kinase